MTVINSRRLRRGSPGEARVMPRELDALAFLAQAQPLTTNQYAKLLGVSLPIAQRSLRKLVALGLVRVHLTSLNAPNLYTLARPACTLLAQELGRSPEEFPIVSGLGKINLPHHAGAVDLYIALRRATTASRSVRLEAFLLEHEIRLQLGGAKGTLVPDAAAQLVDHDGAQLGVAFEIDLATENATWVAERKGIPYGTLWSTEKPLLGCSSWLVCCVVPSERRRNRLVTALWDAGVPEGLWHFAVADTVTEHRILTATWWTPRLAPGNERARLVPENPLQPGRTGWYSGNSRQDGTKLR
jgi:hypothetical protein